MPTFASLFEADERNLNLRVTKFAATAFAIPRVLLNKVPDPLKRF